MILDFNNKKVSARMFTDSASIGLHTHSMINDGDEDLIFFAAVPEQ